MSLHPSLKSADSLKAKKSVLNRSERIKLLMKNKKWSDDLSVLGLPKVKVVKIKASKKSAKKEEKKEEKK